ncbi:hypothetical protein [Paenibacillus xylanexedens]|uniref:hypothetical protein n=1 Tax=Paenibacillus xylanexedens TaxID=528191 RepID=UPI000F5318E0|nr:hypothetical protein [Paenibacillus xylanexedens]RPK20108.1 hypothetical protein EDO6_06647 [Paenibacillus xylanexedens]
MTRAREFIDEMNAKQIESISAINRFIRQGCEFEAPTYNGRVVTRSNLNTIGAGTASSMGINDGNGWNNDVHCDGGDAWVENHEYEGTETSTSPFHSFDYHNIKAEFDRIMDVYLRATGGLRHTYSASTHVHTAIGYNNFGDDNVIMLKLPVMKMYRNVAMFIIRFYPVLKWLSMTNIDGARGAHGNSYDPLDGDALFSWYDDISVNSRCDTGEFGHNATTDGKLIGMQRSSIFRIPMPRHYWESHRMGNESLYDHPILTEAFHFENRMMDCNFSATQMTAWFCLNRAIALWAYDMARNNYSYLPTESEVSMSKQETRTHSTGYKRVDKPYIVESYSYMKSLLAKYFKKMNSMDAWDVLDKLIDTPIPVYLEEKGLQDKYDLTEIEGHFTTRNRERDEALRERYLTAIKFMVVPMAGNLNDFHMNIAAHLQIQQKQAISLYQMFKRENIELEFLSGRLVYMGD